jgi:rhodanese-related sulfurtransferase
MKRILPVSALLASLLPGAGVADDSREIAALQEYLDFAHYTDGTITAGQLASVDLGGVLFIDTRSPERFAAGHIPGAINRDPGRPSRRSLLRYRHAFIEGPHGPAHRRSGRRQGAVSGVRCLAGGRVAIRHQP